MNLSTARAATHRQAHSRGSSYHTPPGSTTVLPSIHITKYYYTLRLQYKIKRGTHNTITQPELQPSLCDRQASIHTTSAASIHLQVYSLILYHVCQQLIVITQKMHQMVNSAKSKYLSPGRKMLHKRGLECLNWP